MLTTNLLILFGSVGLIATITLAIMRFLTNRSPRKEMIENGIVLAQDGIEFQGVFLITTKKISYGELASVELLSFLRGWIAPIVLCYGISVRSLRTRFFSKVIVIRLKHPNPFEYLLFTPKNAPDFAEKLRSYVERHRNENG